MSNEEIEITEMSAIASVSISICIILPHNI
jgi:hypothetical protein